LLNQKKTDKMMKNCCSGFSANEANEKDFEVVKIEKTRAVCPMCEDFAKEQIEKKTPIAVLSCEGACLRGEIARQAANLICFKLLPEKTARICLGGAFTKNTGQRNLVRTAPRVFALEGCFIECGSRMMKGVIDRFKPEIVIVDKLCDFDKKLFAINDLPEEKIKELANIAANTIVEKYINC
jgi:uncharacterized metal-binding protein